MPDYPSFSDGRHGLKDPIVENLNVLISGLPLRYHYIKDSLKVDGRLIEHTLEGEGDLIGMDIKSVGNEKGGLDLQLDKATDVAPLPGHVIRLTKGASVKFYVVTDAPVPMERNNVVRPSVTVSKIINPFFSGLLDPNEGDLLRKTYSIATMLTTETLDPKPLNHRPGSTKVYSATLDDGSALPTGVTISSTTGVISSVKATVVIGVYVIKVVATDTLAPFTNREAEATLVLTITA